MAQIKIYPSTQAQVQAVQNTVDEINSKIVTPNYQDKTVTPSDVQQIVQADNGYNALHSVTVEPIAAAMPQGLEEFIMNSSVEPYSLSLNGAVPAYACYNKANLKRVYGNLTSVDSYAFQGCTSLESIDAPNLTSVDSYAFQNCTSLESIDAPNLTSVDSYAFQGCTSLEKCIIPKMASYLAYGLFTNNLNLKYVDCRTNHRIGNQAFLNCSKLELLDLSLYTGSSPVLDNVNVFSNTNNDWIAVVANDTVKAAFQSATNWSTYASHIKTIAEVEAEVGMSYDDYYLQCFGHPRFDN